MQRREAILDAATVVFIRYGFKKTSMDDVARAAGISRQGLYLHFPTKEALFHEGVLRLANTTRARAQAALSKADGTLEDRIVSAFREAHGQAIGDPGSEHMNELMLAAAQILGPSVVEVEEGIVADLAKLLRTSGVAARWKDVGLSAKQLADNLYSTSCGVKHQAKSLEDYVTRMRVAVQMLLHR